MAIFDRAIFDPAIFDTGEYVPSPLLYGTWKRYNRGWSYQQDVALGNITEYGIYSRTVTPEDATIKTQDSSVVTPTFVADTTSTTTYIKD